MLADNRSHELIFPSLNLPEGNVSNLSEAAPTTLSSPESVHLEPQVHPEPQVYLELQGEEWNGRIYLLRNFITILLFILVTCFLPIPPTCRDIPIIGSRLPQDWAWTYSSWPISYGIAVLGKYMTDFIVMLWRWADTRVRGRHRGTQG